jgi:fission process protein 1
MEINKDVGSDGGKGSIVGDVDLYRDTYVRYVGYANEVGEALRPVYPKVVRPSYGMAFGYVLADTLDKIGKKRAEQAPMEDVVRSGVDCLLWQTLASVLVPGKVTNASRN